MPLQVANPQTLLVEQAVFPLFMHEAQRFSLIPASNGQEASRHLAAAVSLSSLYLVLNAGALPRCEAVVPVARRLALPRVGRTSSGGAADTPAPFNPVQVSHSKPIMAVGAGQPARDAPNASALSHRAHSTSPVLGQFARRFSPWGIAVRARHDGRSSGIFSACACNGAVSSPGCHD
jgi:hypothetical protein